MTPVNGPDFLAIQVRDPERSAEFYGRELGLKCRADSPPGVIAFDTSPIPFAVRKPRGTDLQGGPLGLGVSLSLGADDAQAVYDQLKSHDLTILAAPFDTPFRTTFVFEDPDGYARAVHGGTWAAAPPPVAPALPGRTPRREGQHDRDPDRRRPRIRALQGPLLATRSCTRCDGSGSAGPVGVRVVRRRPLVPALCRQVSGLGEMVVTGSIERCLADVVDVEVVFPGRVAYGFLPASPDRLTVRIEFGVEAL